MKPKVALTLIVKGSDDEAEHLDHCLTSVAPYVDGIFLNLNAKPGHKVSGRVRHVAERFTKNIITTEWHDDFAEARNANLAQVPKDYTHVIWLDADDTVQHPEKIRKIVAAAPTVDCIYADYLYDVDEEGNPLTVHMSGRIFKNNGSQMWKGRIHETLVDTRGTTRMGTKEIVIVHHSQGARKDRSLERNIKMLKAQLESEGDNIDPRTLYYLGCTYLDYGDTENAKELLNLYLTMSGWDDERCAANTKLGRVFLETGNHLEAKKYFMQAIGEAPENPEPQVEMGSLELELKQYQKARKWLEGVLDLKVQPGTLERNPMTYTFRTYLLLADVYMGLGGSYLDKALEMVKKAAGYKKKNRQIREYVKLIGHVVEDKKLAKCVVDLVAKLKKNKEDDKIKNLLASVPKQLVDNPLIVRLRDTEPFTWPEKTIVIMCGDSPIGEWGPWSLKEGIGGSEEAIIRISKHLTDLGYKVVVFANPMARAGLYEGVMWRNYWEINLKDTFDIFIAWRSPYMFDHDIKARKKYLWLHDVMPEGEFTPERIANFDKCIVLSKYHRSLFPMIPDDKILMSGNGIDPEQFELRDGFYDRDAHKVFYGSSHVRGLQYLYDIWPDVLKAVPDATLDVYYGRESYDAINAGNPERIKWMDDMMQRAKELPGVTDHGKIGQELLVNKMFEAGIWAYPTPFPEVYCITAVKAQAAGCVPVCTDFAALDEMVNYGVKVHIPNDHRVGNATPEFLEEYKAALIDMLQHPEKQEAQRTDMMAWARKITWRREAERWVEDFEV